jgi:hypothetical protein
MKRFAVGVALRSKIAGAHSLPGLPNKRLHLTARVWWCAACSSGGSSASLWHRGFASAAGRCMVAARRAAGEPQAVRQQSRKFSWGRKSRCVWLAVFTRAALCSSVSSAWRDLPRGRRLLHGAAAPSVEHLRRRRPKRVAARGAPLWLYSVRRLEQLRRGPCLQAAPPEPEVASLDRRSCRPSRVCFGAALGSPPARIVRCWGAWLPSSLALRSVSGVALRLGPPAPASPVSGFACRRLRHQRRSHSRASGRRRSVLYASAPPELSATGRVALVARFGRTDPHSHVSLSNNRLQLTGRVL